MMRILLDVDGVIANFIGSALPLINERTGKRYTQRHITQWDFIHELAKDAADDVFRAVHRQGFCAAIQPYPGAKAFVQSLRRLGYVYFVTAPQTQSKWWVPERAAWLEQHFSAVQSQIVFTDAKHLVRGDVFIDDRESHCLRWVADGRDNVLPILFGRPYNTDGGLRYRATSYKQALQIIYKELHR